MTYKHWINKNYDRLVSEYEDYFDSIDKEIDVPMSLDEFILDKWDSLDFYVEREEQWAKN